MRSAAEGAPSGELIDLEDPKQQEATKEQRKAFLTADLSKVNSKYRATKQQAGANSANTTADTTWKQATWSDTHSTTDAKATFSALDSNGDGNCHVLSLDHSQFLSPDLSLFALSLSPSHRCS